MSHRLRFVALLALAFGPASGVARAGVIVNIDARLYGYAFPTDPAPVPGQLIAPFSLAPGGVLNRVTLDPGTYLITNATGLVGADPSFTGWRFNSAPNWVWNFVISDEATNRVVFYADAGGIQSSQAAIAARPEVQSFSGLFTLTAQTTLDFMVRDYFLPDNAGGVALNLERVSPQAIPEPGGILLLAAGGPLLGVLACRRRRRETVSGARAG